jgi:hypothetical protein
VAEIPRAEPASFVAGDTVKWIIPDLSDYPIADGWALTYALRGPDMLDVSATAGADGHAVTVSASQTAALTAGRYEWAAYASKDDERFRVRFGATTVTADLSASAGGLTHAAKMLAAIEEVLEGRIPADVESFQIAGRAVNKIPVTELRKLRGIYAAEVEREQSGGAALRTVRFGFVASR